MQYYLTEASENNWSVRTLDRLEFIKNPAVLEFLGLPNNSGYIEAELEKAIIDHIQLTLIYVRSYDRTDKSNMKLVS